MAVGDTSGRGSQTLGSICLFLCPLQSEFQDSERLHVHTEALLYISRSAGALEELISGVWSHGARGDSEGDLLVLVAFPLVEECLIFVFSDIDFAPQGPKKELKK